MKLAVIRSRMASRETPSVCIQCSTIPSMKESDPLMAARSTGVDSVPVISTASACARRWRCCSRTRRTSASATSASSASKARGSCCARSRNLPIPSASRSSAGPRIWMRSLQNSSAACSTTAR
ncbi:Uncharacterised protein [Mycobacteroides abscessus subsp. abscessus]|nr:Uncharacterised protein [Mycobacteroides abscessus subsp. abscessus]